MDLHKGLASLAWKNKWSAKVIKSILSFFCKTYRIKINLGEIQRQFELFTTQELGFRVKKKDYIGCLKEKKVK